MGDLDVRLKYKKDEGDDWTKVEDKILRKKIQNRLAKRKNRDDAKKNKRRTAPMSPPTTDEASQSPERIPVGQREEEDLQIAVLGKKFSMRKVATETSDLDPRLRNYFALPGLAEHRYLQLPQYSLLRAFIRNADMLGLDPFLFSDDDALSPWTVSNPYTPSRPHTLSPTPIQLYTPHHPYIDVIAIPSMRDNMVVAGLSDEQEDELCADMHVNSFSVWGAQPWNAMAWEVSQPFVDKWWWLLGDETVTHSNFWRGERGEAPLKVPTIDLGGMVEEVS